MSLSTLYQNEDKIVTKMGRSFLGERVVYRGKDLHHDMKDDNWIKLFAYGITGRSYTDDEVKALNYIWVSTSYPDKSIWPNHIAALAGSHKTTPGLALSAGVAAFDSVIFGGQPCKAAIEFFIRAQLEVNNGASLENVVEKEIKKRHVLFGYGRPLASTDERVPHAIDFVRSLSLPSTQHFDLAIKVAHLVKRKKQLNMNAAAIYAGLGADLGFTPKTFHTFMILSIVAGMPPCFIEADDQEQGAFLPVRCDRVNYGGPAKREW